MERKTRNMNAGPLLALVVALAATLAPLSSVARAQQMSGEEGEPTGVVWTEESAEPGEEIERWWGVVGAAVCGAEIRIIRVAPAIGMNPYMIAAGLGGCLLAALDVMT